jgi:hypothetical protein
MFVAYFKHQWLREHEFARHKERRTVYPSRILHIGKPLATRQDLFLPATALAMVAGSVVIRGFRDS